MILNKTNLIVFLVGVFLGLCTGFFTAKAIYDQPLEESVTRDTVIVYDTIPHYYPKPVDSATVKYVTKFFPVVKNDTINHFVEVSKMIHDTVAVEVPITTKHYRAMEYDAWVSGYEPSLDSIKVYQRTEYITERVTISKPPNKWELDALAGIDYNTASQRYTPYAGGEITFKPSRLQVGIRGGIIKNGKAEPFAGAVIKYRLY
jgi:hypothetical protein